MKNKTAETLGAVHTYTHKGLLQKERRYTYYLSVPPLIISNVRRLFVRGGLIG